MSNNLVIKIWIIYNNNGIEEEKPETGGKREEKMTLFSMGIIQKIAARKKIK